MIKLDLRTDLEKAAPDKVSPSETCRYTQPCAIGAMMTPEQRDNLAEKGYNSTSIDALILGKYDAEALVDAPEDQIDDLRALQSAFDRGKPEIYAAQYEQLAEKYRAA